MRSLLWCGTVALLLVGAGCSGGRLPTQPSAHPSGQLTAPSSNPASTDAALASALIGQWQGTSGVESSDGTPECIAPFWRTGFTETIAAEIEPRPDLSFGGSDLDLHLRPQASERIHLAVVGSATSISASNWPFLEDCPLVPATCGLEGHFRLNSSEWGCSGTPPEVWITGMKLSAAFVDDSQRRLRGRMQITYDHQPGCSRCGPPWSTATVVKWFEVSKQP